jgi:Mn2+/Fe2+ NRAMP family transporter
MKLNSVRLLALIGPGVLVAATGVGAGDLATGAFAGGRLGLAVLWAVIVGAALKFVINEGLARWQLVTGDTFLEGSAECFGRPLQWLFLVYLFLWSFLVGAALMSACGVAGHAIFPLSDGPRDKIIYGLLHSILALGLVQLGGYRLFEKIMGVCIGIMFVVVIITALALQPSWREIVAGLCMPTIPNIKSDGLQWTVALIGGVGGTLTVLCYGYWIREEERNGTEWIRYCRIDLAVGYAMTAMFGMAMIIIGSAIGEIDNTKGASLVILIADRLQAALGAAGPYARVGFLVGSWGAFFSSLLGVWQSVPYLFADTWNLMQQKETPAERSPVDVKSFAYRGYLWAIATIPALGLFLDFKQIQKIYAVVGALCIPMLAIALLYLNGRSDLVGRYKNSWITRLLLSGALIFFLLAGYLEVHNKLFGSS